ncbi:hypothetical protein ACIQCF_08835 [Streptomyces sp. NPDC088353]|uniref:hypothetical protein n=1 Tax=Streptomyces sp. NPDC088353 TaxID=3365855 RepID=UPI00380D76DD
MESPGAVHAVPRVVAARRHCPSGLAGKAICGVGGPRCVRGVSEPYRVYGVAASSVQCGTGMAGVRAAGGSVPASLGGPGRTAGRVARRAGSHGVGEEAARRG